MAITAFRSQRAMTKMLYSSVLCSGGSATGLERRRAKGLATGARGDDSHTEELSESWEEYNSGSVGTMSSETGRNDPCGCGSGRKYKDCCGTPQFEVASVRVKDVKDVELTPGLADAFTASLDASYLEYFAAACSGLSTKEAERQIAAIPEGERYLTRVLDSLDNAFADFDTETAKLKPSNVILSSAYSNSKCYSIRLRISLKRSIRQQEDIPSSAIRSAIIPRLCADATDCRGGSSLSRNISTAPLGTMIGTLVTISRRLNQSQ
jgi:hypothetical protein